MTISLAAEICIGVFILGLFGILTLCGSRFLIGLHSATLELGFGPKLFILNLNRFRYEIHLFPILFCNVRLERDLRRSEFLVLNVFTLIGLVFISWSFMYASLHTASKLRLQALNQIQATDSGSFAVIKRVQPGSAAEKAGLREGMIITAINGKKPERGRDLVLGYSRSADIIKLDVLPKPSGPRTISIAVKDEQKKSLPLGLSFTIATLPQKAISEGTIALIYGIIKSGLHQAGLSWWDNLALLGHIRLPKWDESNLSLFIYVAAVALFGAALFPAISIIGYKYLPWFALIITLVRPGFWINALLLLILLVLFRKEKDQAFAYYIGLFWLVFYHFGSVFNGLYSGMLLQFAQFKHLELLWTL